MIGIKLNIRIDGELQEMYFDAYYDIEHASASCMECGPSVLSRVADYIFFFLQICGSGSDLNLKLTVQ